MSSQIEALTAWHKAQIGTKEKPLGSNNVRYNTLYYGREVSGEKYKWCMVYVWAGFYECGLSKLFYDGKKTASCTTLMDWAKSKGRFFTSGFKVGDIVLYNWDNDPSSEHTGYITQVISDTDFYAVEGNASDAVKLTHPDRKTILGVFRPEYDDIPQAPQAEEVFKVKMRYLKNGCVGEDVRALQILLEGREYSCGRYGTDGEFGNDTEAAVCAFQDDNKLSVDGIVGYNTMSKLLGV